MFNISLQAKTFGTIALTLVALLSVLTWSFQAIVMKSFSEQEELETRRNMERVRSAIEDNLRALEGTTLDWATWDDTYNYIQGLDQNYFASNLVDDTSMVSNNLNLMVFIDAEAGIKVAKGVDLTTNKYVPVPEGLREHIYPGSILLNHEDAGGLSGILLLDEGPILISAQPILTSAGEGPAAGTLLFGRFLDKDSVARLAKTTLLDISFQAVASPVLAADFQEVLPDLSKSSPVALRASSSSTMSGYNLLDDVYGDPALLMKIEVPREIYARGQSTIQFYLLTLMIAGLVFGAVIMLMLERSVLTRLARLKSDVGRIEVSSDMAGRVSMPGRDELSDVAGSINNMLAALERSREQQREGEERYRAVVEQTTEAIFLVDSQTRRFLDANASSQILLGYDRTELSTLTLDDIMEPDVERRSGILPRLRTTGSLHLAAERRYRRKNGTVVTVEVSDSPILSGGRDALCVVARDITDRKRAEAVLRDLAMRDGLTGLYNRREMQRILQEQLETHNRIGKPVSLIMLDIDHFKSVNDTYGHQIGDDVLRWISRLSQELIRVEDNVARYGGEELAVILPDTCEEAAYEVAERIRSSVAAHPFEFTQTVDDKSQQTLIPITISLGISSVPEDASTIESLIETADKALYQAKHLGRNRIACYSQMRAKGPIRLVR